MSHAGEEESCVSEPMSVEPGEKCSSSMRKLLTVMEPYCVHNFNWQKPTCFPASISSLYELKLRNRIRGARDVCHACNSNTLEAEAGRLP